MEEPSIQPTSVNHLDLQEKNLARQLDWIGRHDTKASVALGLATGMLGILASMGPKPSAWTPLVVVLMSPCVVLLGSSFLFVYLGNYPKTGGPKSLIFFETIAGLPIDEYKTAALSQSREDYLQDLLTQSHVVASIVARKFWALKWAYRMLFLALPPWAACIYLFKAA